jgi:hypothetical protein
MDDATKLAVIIGCSLGGAALIVILILILVCICSRKKQKNERKLPVQEGGQVNYSYQKSGMPPNPQFTRNGSQQWRNNYSMGAATPVVAAAEGQGQRPCDVTRAKVMAPVSQQVQSHSASNTNPNAVPWYQRTLGRARQFFIHRPITYQSKRASGEQLVDGYQGKSSDGHLASGVNNSAYILNRRNEAPVAKKRISDLSEDSATKTYITYGSETTLVPNEYITSSLENNGALHGVPAVFRPINHGYGGLEQHALGRPPMNLREITREVTTAQVSNPKVLQQLEAQRSRENIDRGQILNPAYARHYASGIPKTDSKLQGMDQADGQMSIPRPVVVSHASNQRVGSIMPPNTRAPQRLHNSMMPIDETNYKQSSPLSDAGSIVSNQFPINRGVAHGDGNRLNVQAVIEQSSKSQVSHSQSEEKNMIGEAFKFLDDLEG